MENEHQNYQFDTRQRLGAGIMGIFLMSFGMPFTLVPTIIIPEAISSGNSLITVFLICFSIPFLLAGLGVQYAGFTSLWMAFFPNSKKALKMYQKMGHIERTDEKEISIYWSSDSSTERRNEEIRTEPVSIRPPKPAEQTTNIWDNVEVRKP